MLFSLFSRKKEKKGKKEIKCPFCSDLTTDIICKLCSEYGFINIDAKYNSDFCKCCFKEFKYQSIKQELCYTCNKMHPHKIMCRICKSLDVYSQRNDPKSCLKCHNDKLKYIEAIKAGIEGQHNDLIKNNYFMICTCNYNGYDYKTKDIVLPLLNLIDNKFISISGTIDEFKLMNEKINIYLTYSDFIGELIDFKYYSLIGMKIVKKRDLINMEAFQKDEL